jgi:arginyl-tRNA--protein-N-Asp/Glu arginylyltransferase
MKVNTCNNENTDYIIHPSYLNHYSTKFNLGFTKPAGSRFAFRIVDRNYNVILSLDSVYSNGLLIDVQGFDITNDTVRMYYKFFGPDCELKGHGDIKILK